MSSVRTTAIVMIAIMFSVLSIIPASSQDTSGVVKEGEPLHIYLKRDIVQNLNYLDFHPPDVDKIDSDNLYRMTLQQKGNAEDHQILYFPRARESNFLQFEPNITLKFQYHFWILATPPSEPTPVDPVFKVKVKIEMDLERGDIFQSDRTVSFDLSNLTSPEPQLLKGEVSINIGELEEFDGMRGGRLRVNISRQDSLPSIVNIYSGSEDRISWFQLPYSKYKYEDDGQDNGENNSLYIIVILFIIMVVVIVGILIYKDASVKKEKEEEEKGKRRRRRR